MYVNDHGMLQNLCKYYEKHGGKKCAETKSNPNKTVIETSDSTELPEMYKQNSSLSSKIGNIC